MLTLTAKIRLYPSAIQAKQFVSITNEYKKLCNVVSKWYFDNHFNVNRKQFNKEMYYQLKALSPTMNTAMIQSVYRTVKARYDSVQTQLFKHPFKYNTGQKKQSWKSYLEIYS